MRIGLPLILPLIAVASSILCGVAQQPGAVIPAAQVPIAQVKLDSGATVAGSLTVSGNRATIGSSGSVTAGARTAVLTLPNRGQIRLCSTTRATFTMDPSHAAADHSGLMISLDRGALETSFQTGVDSDVILTPDFRILISGPGKSSVQVRLGDHGDTCVDNPGKNSPYVTVSSLFSGGAYRVQPRQRVLFQHGSLTEVVDNEEESCGCPAAPTRTLGDNAFPVAQSAGLAPLPAPPPNATQPGVVHAEATASLSYNGADTPAAVSVSHLPASSAAAKAALPKTAAVQSTASPHKPGVFHRIGHFFRHLFGGS